MMDEPKRRRATDATGLYWLWISLPLVDRHTGEWSLSRTMAAGFGLGTLHLMESTHASGATWAQTALIVSLASLALASAFGKRVFEAVALRIAGQVPKAVPTAGEG